MIGPISGEIIMAPIITGTLLVFSPNDATKMAKIRISNCEPLKDTEERISCSASCWGSRSDFMLKYEPILHRAFFSFTEKEESGVVAMR